MRPGTNTGLYITSKYDPKRMDEVEVIRRLHEAGFEAMDFSLSETEDPQALLQQEDWQERADRIADTAAKYGMVFSQCHLPFHKRGNKKYDSRFKDPGKAAHFEECMERAYIISGMVGVPWGVAHCIDVDGDPDPAEGARINHAYYDRFVEIGIKNGVGTAFENMTHRDPRHDLRPRYSEDPDELIEFVDSYKDPMVGICWDFGHANLAEVDQPAALRRIGKRLKCLHVDDNFGRNDNHLIPFLGVINWLDIFPVLAEIGYTGDCSLEVGPVAKKSPRDLQPLFVKTACEAAKYLCGIYDRAAEALKDQEKQGT